MILLALALVGFGATVAVRALVRIAEVAGVPEFVIAFFGASIGTSAPELVVDVVAIRQGAVAIAVGDALGSSLVDATLSIGVGPIVRPGALTEHIAVAASVYSLAAVAVAGGLLGLRRRHDRRSAFVLLALYALAYVRCRLRVADDVFAIAVFTLALALIALEWVHRTKVALVGAGVFVLAGVLDQEHAFESIDWRRSGCSARW